MPHHTHIYIYNYMILYTIYVYYIYTQQLVGNEMVASQILPTRGLSLDGSFRPALWREAKELLDASASGMFGSQVLMEKTF